ncbi:hypothetical protein VCCP1040_3434, partial [Vibrio cholerae CP1040(13)]
MAFSSSSTNKKAWVSPSKIV